MVCRKEQGILLLREFHGSEKKLLFQQEVLKKLSQEGCLVDTYIENQEGSLVTRDKDNIPYTLQNWYEGRECDTKSREDIIRSVQILARVHKFMNMPVEKAYMARSLADEYTRHNQVIRKIRKFIRQKGASARFEKEFLGSVQWFLEKGEKALEMLVKSDYEKLRDKAGEEGLLCHGEYNQHNVLLCKNQAAVPNFGHFSFDVQISDLYCFMRKILENITGMFFWPGGCWSNMTKYVLFPLENGKTCKSVSHIRKNTGNWQITTFLITKHGFPARIRKSWKR